MDIHFSRDLEDAFFYTENKKLLERLHGLKEMTETKENLSKISGIKDDAVLQRLVELNVRPETLVSLSLIPLVEVAWADGSVDEGQQRVILRAAVEMGMRQGNVDYDLLQEWLTHKPSPDLLSAWIEYMRQLCGQLNPEAKRIIKLDLVEHATAVANASDEIVDKKTGSRISESEVEVIKKLKAVFGD